MDHKNSIGNEPAEMSQTTFSIAYDGPALRDGTMDVRELAPALLAVGQLFDASNSVLNGADIRVAVNVKATDEGSFEVFLEIVQTVPQIILEFIKGEHVTTALRLRELVLIGGGTTLGLLALVRRLRGKTPARLERVSTDHVRITLEDESFEVPIELLRLYRDTAVRTALENLIDPLKQEGIDTFRTSNGDDSQTVTDDEVRFFQSPAIESNVIIEETTRAAFSVVSVTFKEGNKWRLNDGNSDITVSINDDDFIRRVQNRTVSFTSGDMLICDVRRTQTVVGDRLRTDHVVERVIDHLPGGRQTELEFDDETE